MEPTRIAILEGYEPDSLGTPVAGPAPALAGVRGFEWHACKIGRRVVVERYPPLHAGEGGQCGGNAKFHVAATSKKAAHKAAVAKFREERASKRQARVASLSGLQTAAQKRFTAAAHECRRQAGSGGRKGKYLSCMREKLKK